MEPVHKTWSTPLAAGVVLLLGGVALIAAAAASYADPPAMVFIGVAAVILFVVGAVTLVRRPRLALAAGPVLIVRTLTGRMRLSPGDVERISMLSTRRLAARGRQLVVDLADGTMLIFGRWDLGTDPRAVAHELRSAGFPVEE